jgi:glycosyltransferase involved in cell wall biosynthesis
VAFVDVIIPVFNTPFHFFMAALSSLRAQTFSNWEAWIVNDASDKSYTVQLVETLQSYADPRIHYLYTEHKGPAGSRNVGIVEGEAPYVAFLDSDDCWMPHHLSRQVALLKANAEIALVHAHCEVIDTEGQRLHAAPAKVGLNDLSTSTLFAALLKENFVAASSVVVRRRMLEEVGGFDDTFPCLVDKELWLRLLNKGARFHYDPEVSFQYRVHPQNISKRTDVLLATRRRMIEKAEGFVRSNPMFADMDWPALKREMICHMYREAAAVHLEQGRYAQALQYSSPFYAGMSRSSYLLFLRSLYRSLTTRLNSGKA